MTTLKAFVIYGKPDCKWCALAKDLLDSIGWAYTYVDVKQDEQARNRLRELSITKVPTIWFGDDLIGGYAELLEWHNSRTKHVSG